MTNMVICVCVYTHTHTHTHIYIFQQRHNWLSGTLRIQRGDCSVTKYSDWSNEPQVCHLHGLSQSMYVTWLLHIFSFSHCSVSQGVGKAGWSLRSGSPRVA